MKLNQVLSHVQRPHISNSTSVVDSALRTEPCSKWLKRLWHNPSDSLGLHTKRSKIGNGLSSGEACSLFSKVLNQNTSWYDIMKCLEQNAMHDWTKYSQSTAECSPGVSEKDVQTWIRRWCKKNPQTTETLAAAGLVLCVPENLKVITENYVGKQFPSIAAMALMGKAINNIRTSEFQRRGSSVVWKTESS